MNTTQAIALLFAVAAFGLGASMLIDKVINPWLSKRRMDKFLADLGAGKIPKRTDIDFELYFDDVGFSVIDLKKDARETMEWSAVEKVISFKRDLFTVDQICLWLARADESCTEVNEDMKGWLEFTTALPKYLAGCKPLDDWIFSVTHPAFATNLTERYSRGSSRLETAATVG